MRRKAGIPSFNVNFRLPPARPLARPPARMIADTPATPPARRRRQGRSMGRIMGDRHRGWIACAPGTTRHQTPCRNCDASAAPWPCGRSAPARRGAQNCVTAGPRIAATNMRQCIARASSCDCARTCRQNAPPAPPVTPLAHCAGRQPCGVARMRACATHVSSTAPAAENGRAVGMPSIGSRVQAGRHGRGTQVPACMQLQAHAAYSMACAHASHASARGLRLTHACRPRQARKERTLLCSRLKMQADNRSKARPRFDFP